MKAMPRGKGPRPGDYRQMMEKKEKWRKKKCQ